MQPHTLLRQNCWINVQYICGNFIVTKQEILVISFSDFFDAVSWRYSDVILLPAVRRVSGNDFVPAGQCTSTLRRARRPTKVELLHQETPNLLASKLWPPNSPDINPVITRSGLSCSIVSTADKSIVWMNWNGGSSMSGAVLNSRFLTRLLTSGEEEIKHVSMLKEDIWTVNWQCWFCPYLLHSVWLVWLLHL